jgi:hypothetical protein
LDNTLDPSGNPIDALSTGEDHSYLFKISGHMAKGVGI